VIILTSPTIIGLLAGLALVARRRGWLAASLARGLGGGSMILLGVGAGLIMLPSLLFGTLAAARTDWPRWARGLLALLALVPVGALLTDTVGLSWLQLAVALVGTSPWSAR
jgi:hypothetical protein